MPRSAVRLGRMVLGSSLLAFLVCPAVADPAPPPLAAHHALYKLSLSKAEGSKAPAAVDGLIDYNFSGSACEGYAMTFRQVTNIQPAEGDSRLSDMKSATFENGDEKEFRFDTTTTYNSSGSEAVLGQAVKKSDGSLSVDLKKPDNVKADLPAALFPTEHLQKVLEAARAGKKTILAPVYDGSDTGQKIFDTFSVIGAPITDAPPDKAANIDALKGMRRWPVSISYFEQGKNAMQPAYIMAFELFDDGISRSLKLDYGNFSLAGELTELSLSPVSTCGK